MTPIITSREQEIATALLNETILRAASDVDADILSPEETLSTADIVTWNGSPETLGLRIPEMPCNPQVTIAEQLVTAGEDEADIEQRSAAMKE